MDIRQLQYLAALTREKHFTRAAAACNVTQPTLSGRIRQLELELEVPIVERGQRYRGLTSEGERVLKWAHVILKSWQSMQEELGHLKDHDSGLTGRLVLGGIPSSLPIFHGHAGQRLMIVGQAPGPTAGKRPLPFSGPSGRSSSPIS